MTISYDDFERVDVRVGRITRAEPFPEARKPSLKLWIDFGSSIGERRSSAQLAANYDPAALVGRLVLAVTNFAPRQIATFMSEVLVLGVPDENGAVVLVAPDRDVPLGGRLY
jgi:tRNA-binding protein